MPAICKVDVQRRRSLTLRHAGSGATKVVEYLGLSGIPLRAQVHWPGAGEYLVSPRTGTLLGERRNQQTRRAWQLVEVDREFVRREYRRELHRWQQAKRSQP